MLDFVNETNVVLKSVSDISGLSVFTICSIGIILAFILFKITKTIISIAISLIVTLFIVVVSLNFGLF